MSQRRNMTHSQQQRLVMEHRRQEDRRQDQTKLLAQERQMQASLLNEQRIEETRHQRTLQNEQHERQIQEALFKVSTRKWLLAYKRPGGGIAMVWLYLWTRVKPNLLSWNDDSFFCFWMGWRNCVFVTTLVWKIVLSVKEVVIKWVCLPLHTGRGWAYPEGQAAGTGGEDG